MNKLFATVSILALTIGAANAVPYQVGPTDLSLRSGPGTNYPLVGVLPVGVTVGVGRCTARTDGIVGSHFCEVAYGAMHGWAATSHLTAVGSPVAGVCSTPIPTSDGYVYLRSGPGTGFPVIAQLHNGDHIWEGGYEGDWVHAVGINGAPANGWIHGKYTTNVPCGPVVAPVPVAVPVAPVPVAPIPVPVAPVPVPASTPPVIINIVPAAPVTNTNTINVSTPPPVVVNGNNNNNRN
jgi:uncharacterized protein YraI